MSRFTIGIPTFNRASFLQDSLQAALHQSAPDVQVIVVDNASTDDTSAVARRFGNGVQYYRNDENIGSLENFKRTATLSSTQYFSWLQDDDVVHCEFVARALEAFDRDPAITVYSAYTLISASLRFGYDAILYGPEISLDWMSRELLVLDGLVTAPLALLSSVAIPPALAFRTDALKRALKYSSAQCELYSVERIIVAAAASEGKIAFDPWPAAIFRSHDNQGFKRILETDPNERWIQWVTMANTLGALLESRGNGWQKLFGDVLREVPEGRRASWLRDGPPLSYWSQAHPVALQIRAALVASLPGYRDREAVKPKPSRLRNAVKALAPPILWNAAATLREKLKGQAGLKPS